jgi:hypothetical protein
MSLDNETLTDPKDALDWLVLLLRDEEIESRPALRISWFRFYVVFVSSQRQVLGQHVRLDWLLPDPFPFTIFTVRPAARHYYELQTTHLNKP